MLKVPLLDLKAQYAAIKDEIDQAVVDVFESQYFINGPQVAQCENAIADYCGVKYGIGTSSGTDALLITLMAEGIGPGDEVITTDYSFFATAGSVTRTGAKPIFVDIDHDSCNINPSQIEAVITDRTKAIIPVHLYGRMVDVDPIMEIADRYGLIVIEDAAQAIGAEYKGRRAGSIGHYGCFSFYPAKNLGCAGDGGMVVTDVSQRADRLKVFRDHGADPKYHHKYIGGNFRLDTIQAAILLAKLPHLDQWTEARQQNADRYRILFRDKKLFGNGVKSIPTKDADRHIYHQFVVRVYRRDDLKAFLNENGIGCEIYYPIPFHLQECFADLGYRKGDFPESELAADETLALPIYPELTDDQAEYIVDCIRKFYS